MATGMNNIPNFDDACDWPRRLLHIPTMKSVPWTHGNCYGNDCEPRYIAISYTWGRWKLKPGQLPNVDALPVDGVTWEIPRVDPVHFSVAEFKNVLESAAKLFYDYEALNNPGKPPSTINYIWLDVACVNQTRGSAEMAAEIGRQAKIFKGATMAFVWLTKLSRQGFLAQMKKDEEDGKASRSRATNSLERKQSSWDMATAQVEHLSLDPWFSSLWTLQEAYLCPHAIFITREGEFLTRSDDATAAEDPFLLEDFIDFCDQHLRMVVYEEQSPESTVSNDGRLLKLRQALELSGMAGIRWQLPITLLGAAHHRKTRRPEDRVYGIMQVFGFRLGKSRPGCDPKRDFTLPELEDELGKELLEREPIMSQMHVFAKRPQVGKGWRIAQDSQPTRRLRLVNETYGEGKSAIEDMLPQAQLSTTTLGGATWGQSSGKICTFSKLVDAWDSASGWGDGIVDLDGMENWTAIHGPGLARKEAIGFSHKNPDAVVLLLGIQDKNGYYANRRRPLGLLLVPSQTQAGNAGTPNVWQRMGLCEWSTASSSGNNGDMETAKLFEGESQDWSVQTGVFG